MSTIDIAPKQLALILAEGDSRYVTFNFVDAAGDPVDVSDRTWTCDLPATKQAPSAVTITVDATGSNLGVVVCDFPAGVANPAVVPVRHGREWFLYETIGGRRHTILGGALKLATPADGAVGPVNNITAILSAQVEILKTELSGPALSVSSATVDAAGAVMNTDATTAEMQFVIDEDSMVSDLATKVPTQQSVKAYVDAATADQTDLSFTRDATTVTVESDTGTDAVLPAATTSLAGVFVAADKTKLDGVETAADVTDEANVVAALDGATLTGVTVAGTDKVIVQDVSDSGNIKTVTAQSIADLGVGATDLTWTAATSVVASSTGTDATLTVADSTNPGLMTSANFDKLAAITGTNTGDDPGYEPGGTDVAVADGGTGASTASDARTNLGLAIGTNVQAWSAVLDGTTASFTTADETKLDGIETAATADQSAAEILAALLTVDGAGSGLDADLLDGNSSAAFATAAQANATHTGDVTGATALTIATPSTVTVATGDLVLIKDVSDSNAFKAVTASSIAALVSATSGQIVYGTGTAITSSSPHQLTANNVRVAAAAATLSGTYSGVAWSAGGTASGNYSSVTNCLVSGSTASGNGAHAMGGGYFNHAHASGAISFCHGGGTASGVASVIIGSAAGTVSGTNSGVILSNSNPNVTGSRSGFLFSSADQTIAGNQCFALGYSGTVATGLLTMSSNSSAIIGSQTGGGFGLSMTGGVSQAFIGSATAVGASSITSATSGVIIASNGAATVSGQQAVVMAGHGSATQNLSFAICGGDATLSIGTFAHGNGNKGYGPGWLAAPGVGFRGKAPVAGMYLAADATDLASAIALVNDIKNNCLIAQGLAA